MEADGLGGSDLRFAFWNWGMAMGSKIRKSRSCRLAACFRRFLGNVRLGHFLALFRKLHFSCARWIVQQLSMGLAFREGGDGGLWQRTETKGGLRCPCRRHASANSIRGATIGD